MKILCYSRCRPFVGAKPFFLCFILMYKHHFLSPVVIRKMNPWLRPWRESKPINIVARWFCCRWNYADTMSQLLNLSRWLKVMLYGFVEYFIIFWLYPPRLVWIFMNILVQFNLVELNGSPDAHDFEVEIVVFEALKLILRRLMRHCFFSIHFTNLSNNFCSFGTSIKCKNEKVSKMLFFVDLTLQFNELKGIKSISA